MAGVAISAFRLLLVGKTNTHLYKQLIGIQGSEWCAKTMGLGREKRAQKNSGELVQK